MYPQMVYHADVRAREKELAAERQMGSSCSPLGRMISGVIRKCNGRKGRVRYDERMDDYAMAYAPAQTCYVRPSARTVTLASTPTANHPPANSDAVQPEPPRAHTPFPSTGAPPQGARKPKKKKKKKKHVRFTPSAGPVPGDEPPPPPHAQHHAASTGGAAAGAGTASVVYHHGAAEAPYSSSPAAPPPAHGGHGGHGYAYGYGYGRYAPSPLPRWEVLGTPRRHEYFSSEYRWYYPTPVREGIYSFATDANGRLSNFFSEENPNACTIV